MEVEIERKRDIKSDNVNEMIDNNGDDDNDRNDTIFNI